MRRRPGLGSGVRWRSAGSPLGPRPGLCGVDQGGVRNSGRVRIVRPLGQILLRRPKRCCGTGKDSDSTRDEGEGLCWQAARVRRTSRSAPPTPASPLQGAALHRENGRGNGTQRTSRGQKGGMSSQFRMGWFRGAFGAAEKLWKLLWRPLPGDGAQAGRRLFGRLESGLGGAPDGPAAGSAGGLGSALRGALNEPGCFSPARRVLGRVRGRGP